LPSTHLPNLSTMMLWIPLFCLFSANLVFSQDTVVKPEILADYDPDTTMQPSKGNMVDRASPDSVIRGLLRARQTQCPAGYAACTDASGECCPVGDFCYGTGCCPAGTSGCEGNSCCTAGETCCSGGGCCDPGYYCVVVNGERGCCLNGKTCTTSGTPQCQTATYVLCPGDDFCCPPGYTCSRDAGGNPQCSLGGNSPPPSLTNTNTPNTNNPSGTFLGTPSPSTNTQGPPTVVVPPTTSTTLPASNPTPSSNNNNNNNGNSGAASSAISVVIDAVFTFFAGVGVFAYLV